MDISFEVHRSRTRRADRQRPFRNFIDQNLRSHFDATTAATTWLTDQLDELKVKVKNSEDARIDYERQNQIWTLDDKQNMTTQRFSDINRQLTEAQGERMKKQSLFEFAKTGRCRSGSANSRQRRSSGTASQRRAELSAQYTEALNQYGPNFPKVQRLQAQLKEIDQQSGKRKTEHRRSPRKRIP